VGERWCTTWGSSPSSRLRKRKGQIALLAYVIFLQFLLAALRVRIPGPILTEIAGSNEDAHLAVWARYYVTQRYANPLHPNTSVTLENTVGRLYRYPYPYLVNISRFVPYGNWRDYSSPTWPIGFYNVTFYSRDGSVRGRFAVEWVAEFRNLYTKESSQGSRTYANYTMLYAHRYLFSTLANMTLRPSISVTSGECDLRRAGEGVWVLGVPLSGTCLIQDEYGVRVVAGG